ncbi:MAG: DMT family transporter [Parcubacteria group bacterium]|nr:DMT family transporter [Parcubacteria group bacterium]
MSKVYFENKNQFRGLLLIVVSALLFGSYGVWSKFIGDDFGVFFQGYSRALLVALALFPILYFTGQIVPIQKKDWGWLSVFSIFSAFVAAPVFYAFTHMDIGTASLLFFVTMLLTMYAVGFLFLGEKITVTKVAAFVLACAGLYVTFSFSLVAFSLLAASMAVLNGIGSGGEVSSSKKLTNTYSPLYISWIGHIVIVLTNAPVSLLLGEVQRIPSFDMVWIWQAVFALASLLGTYFIFAGLKHVESSVGGLLGLLEVVFAIAFGILLFHEVLSPQIIVGSILILSAAALPHVVDLLKPRLSS